MGIRVLVDMVIESACFSAFNVLTSSPAYLCLRILWMGMGMGIGNWELRIGIMNFRSQLVGIQHSRPRAIQSADTIGMPGAGDGGIDLFCYYILFSDKLLYDIGSTQHA